MNFINKQHSPFYEGITAKGNTILYRFIREDRLRFYKSDTEERATLMSLKCNFAITMPMLDLLESSKIIHIEGMVNDKDRHKIWFHPLPLFDYIKLNDILFDMCQKFQL